tara:strand:- start:186 stop:662 length:477 start_codon:yes stop_codon:yes gene_type:complete
MNSRPLYKDIVSVYGEPGDPSNLTTIVPPFPMYLSWDKSKKISKITCHKLISRDLFNALTEILEHYGLERIKYLGIDIYGGCLNVRKMRGGKKWSTHSWGIAIDLDPANNRLRWKRDKAHFAGEHYDVMFEIFLKHGFHSLGKEKDYDWMHLQAVKIK